MVTIEKVRDEYGNGMDLGVYEEIRMFANFDVPRKLRSMKNFKYEEGDVFVCGFPKCGNHWTSALLYLLLNAKTPQEIQTCKIPMMPLIDMLSTQKLAKRPAPRLFDSHMLYHRLPEDHVRNGGKIILIVRNPKDVAVSFYHHFKNIGYMDVINEHCWDFFLKCFLNGKVFAGSYFDYLNSWQNVIKENQNRNILVVYYEDMVQDCLGQLQRIQQFLGVNRNEDILHQIVTRCSFKGLQKSIDGGNMITLVVNNSGESVLFRKGQIGDWKTHFTRDQNETFDKSIREKLQDSMFQFSYEDITLKHKL